MKLHDRIHRDSRDEPTYRIAGRFAFLFLLSCIGFGCAIAAAFLLMIEIGELGKQIFGSDAAGRYCAGIYLACVVSFVVYLNHCLKDDMVIKL